MSTAHICILRSQWNIILISLFWDYKCNIKQNHYIYVYYIVHWIELYTKYRTWSLHPRKIYSPSLRGLYFFRGFKLRVLYFVNSVYYIWYIVWWWHLLHSVHMEGLYTIYRTHHIKRMMSPSYYIYIYKVLIQQSLTLWIMNIMFFVWLSWFDWKLLCCCNWSYKDKSWKFQ